MAIYLRPTSSCEPVGALAAARLLVAVNHFLTTDDEKAIAGTLDTVSEGAVSLFVINNSKDLARMSEAVAQICDKRVSFALFHTFTDPACVETGNKWMFKLSISALDDDTLNEIAGAFVQAAIATPAHLRHEQYEMAQRAWKNMQAAGADSLVVVEKRSAGMFYYTVDATPTQTA